jgi:hypothetical protein
LEFIPQSKFLLTEKGKLLLEMRREYKDNPSRFKRKLKIKTNKKTKLSMEELKTKFGSFYDFQNKKWIFQKRHIKEVNIILFIDNR